MRVYIPAQVRRQGRILLNQQCWLWGQDVREGIYINRYGFTPRLAAASRASWQSVEEMRSLPATADTLLLEKAVWWIADYERWVLANYGKAYRTACLAGWGKYGLPDSGLPAAWEMLACELALCSPQSAAS